MQGSKRVTGCLRVNRGSHSGMEDVWGDTEGAQGCL